MTTLTKNATQTRKATATRKSTPQTPDERYRGGRQLRRSVPRESHAGWTPPPGRQDPVETLCVQEEDRLPTLVPVRHGRMAASPFGFLRGAAAVMATDLAGTPSTGITVQACGDAHLLNFGVFASPERTLLFDVNDFDETLPGPWEWDVKRLAASLVVAARENGMSEVDCRRIVGDTVRRYREQMRIFAGMRELDLFYTRLPAKDVMAQVKKVAARRRTKRALHKAEHRDNLQALAKLTTIVDGHRRIIDDPPLLQHVEILPEELLHREIFDNYRRTLHSEVGNLLTRYQFVDGALKVVGVGSVGTRCMIAVFEGRDSADPLVLQVKEATRSALEPFGRRSVYRNQGERVVCGQRLMQANSDIFLGWLRGPAGRDFYWRQLRDMKGSADPANMSARELAGYGEMCGWTLARAHAVSGDRIRIAGYLGSGKAFDSAVTDFALCYADQSNLDHQALRRAIDSGVITAVEA